MPLELFVFLAGLVVSLILAAAGIAFTIYETRRTNPGAFEPESHND